MLTFSTDHLVRRDRFEYWRETVARRMLGLDAEIEPERRLDFTGRGRLVAVGTASLVTIVNSAHVLCAPRAAALRPAAEGALYIWTLVHGGGSAILDDRAERVGGGMLVTRCEDASVAYRPDLGLFRPGGLSEHRGVMVPRPVFSDLPVAAHPSAPRQHRNTRGLDALLRSYLAAFLGQASHLAGPRAEQAVRILAQLALVARGAIDPRDETGSAAIREGLLVRAHRLIERDLHRVDLTPARAAAELGVSVRGLHLAFEPSGESFGRRLLARRLDRADRLLREASHLPVTEVAFAAGFGSLSTFFRCYRAAYGASPGERRAAPEPA